MSKGWQRSGLKVGEEIRIPTDLFVTGKQALERLVSATYIGEVSAGLLVSCKFKPGLRNTISNEVGYRIMIPWASIYCGQVKVYRDDSTSIIAKRIRDIKEEEIA